MTIHRLPASGLRQSASTNQEYCYEAGNSPDRTAPRIANSAMIAFQPQQRQNHHKFHQNQRHDFRPCAFPAWPYRSIRTSTSLMTYLLLLNLCGTGVTTLMLAFYNPASPHSNWQRGFPSRSFLVTYRLQSRPIHRHCNTRSQRNQRY